MSRPTGRIRPDCRELIYSPAVPFEDPDRSAARAIGISERPLPEFLAELTRSFEAVCVAGTHGKSTTTAALCHLYTTAGESISGYCGAEAVSTGRHGFAGSSRTFVVESCEFRRHFLSFSPHAVVLTGIDWDHVDSYRDLTETVEVFAEFVARCPEGGQLIVNGDSAPTLRAVAIARKLRGGPQPCRSVGFGAGCDWQILPEARGGALSGVGQGTIHWTLRSRTRREAILLQTSLPGLHNVLNLSLAAAYAIECGLPVGDVRRGIASFPGVRRRLQPLGQLGGRFLYDDYAHHPTAIRAAVAALRQRHPRSRILVNYEPHQVRRTRVLFDDFVRALATADAVCVLPAYGAREALRREECPVHVELARAVRHTGIPAEALPSLDSLPGTLETVPRPGDVVVIMGAGSIERIADEFSRRLCRHHAG